MATITDSIGRVLAGRYRIESPLGSGASAHVFAAWDVTLQRRVAIKVLHPSLTGDGPFLRRFRAEAQAAASIGHPNVLAVYDWGEDGQGPFLVLEFVGGGSLRDLLDGGRRLSVPQAVAVGAEAADGLTFAHGRGFVHRDVKPANLLFGEEGRLRIADFGIARALAEAAFTEPAGATVGTARYAAPEQAQGHPVDGRADVYGLALVLYEAVTGVVPFAADTTIGTLMGRVGARLPGHDALGPLGEVLDAAAASEPGARIVAAELGVRLRQLAEELPSPEPLPLAGPGGMGVMRSGAAPVDTHDSETSSGLGGATTASGSAAFGSSGVSGASAAFGSSGAAGASGVGGTSEAGGAPGVGGASGVGGAPVTDDVTEIGLPVVGWDDEADHADVFAVANAVGVADASSRARAARRARRPRLRLALRVIVVVLAIAAVAGGAAFGVVQAKLFVPSHRLPAVVGQSSSAARAALQHDHLKMSVVRHRWSVTVPTGYVIREIPKAGTSLKEGTTVGVVLSSGPPPVAVPSLASVSGDCPAVTALLQSARLHVDCTHQSSTTVAKGSVMDWSPKTQATLGSAVHVVVSSGPPMETVPSLTGSTCAGATTALSAIGLTAQCANAYSTTVPSGQVIDWNPKGQIPEGSTVVVQISQGPPPVVVPNVVGHSVAQAITMLEDAGLVPGTDQGPLGGTVFDSNPPPGASVPQGTSVTLYSK